MMSALKKLTSRKTFEEKLYDEIFDLLNYAKPKGNSQKESLANFILKKNEKKNSKNPNYKFKSELYKISNKISMLEVTNPNKLPLLSTLENVETETDQEFGFSITTDNDNRNLIVSNPSSGIDGKVFLFSSHIIWFSMHI